MRKTLLILAVLAPLSFGQTQTVSYAYNGVPIQIYPDSWNVVSYARVLVPKSLMITSVTATVKVQFSHVGDLNVYMASPAGTRTKLLERNCDSLVNIDTTFDDAATTRYAEFCPAEAGRGPFSGNEPLANSKGQNSLGYWTLAVENNGSDRSGSLIGFSVNITGTTVGSPSIYPQTIVSASSFKSGTVSPGEMIGIFGVNLGPTEPVRSSPSSYPTGLAGTAVRFNGIPAPLAYVSDALVVVQTPAGLAPGQSASIQVAASSGSSQAISLPVVAVRPGVITNEAGPTGQAKAVNEDGTINGDGSATSTDRAAPKGSMITISATGLGIVDPALPDGASAPFLPPSYTVSPVTATVGGVATSAVTAWASPGEVGIYKVSVRIPLNAPSGKTSIVLLSGGVASQDGATIQIR